MKTVAYLRVSTRSQDLANQKLAILEYAHRKQFAVDRFIGLQSSSLKVRHKEHVGELLDSLKAGDRLIVSELSRLGRSLGQVIQIVDTLVHRKVRFMAVKEGITFEGKQDLQTKVMIALFGLFAEVERDLIKDTGGELNNWRKKYPIPESRQAQRSLFSFVLQQPQYACLVTAQYRDLKDLSDEDIETCLEDLAELGILDEMDKTYDET